MNLDDERIRELQRKDQEHDARLDMQKERMMNTMFALMPCIARNASRNSN